MAAPLRLQLEGKYEILEKIKEGGMGTVYKVRHRFLDEIRVIKVIRSALEPTPELSERFLREARMAIRLRHPSLAVLYDFAVDDDGNAFIVMEYIAGLTFEDLLRTGGPPPLGLALEIASQALRAIGYLHRHGFVHRDIAPDNLMLTRGVDGEPLVKLLDLGIAKVLAGEGGTVTSTGLFLGKPRYASPEHFGVQELDERSDLYSFGVVLYELLTGRCPVAGHDPASYMAGHLFRPPLDFAASDPAGALPAELRRVVLRALAKTRSDRFATAADFALEIAALQERFPVHEGDLEAVLEPSTRRTAPWSVPSPAGSSQGLLDRQFLAGPTPQPTTPAAGPDLLAPADMRAAAGEVPEPNPSAPPPAPQPTPRPNPALDDTLPLTVHDGRPVPVPVAGFPPPSGRAPAPAVTAAQQQQQQPGRVSAPAITAAPPPPSRAAVPALTLAPPSLAARTLAGVLPAEVPGAAARELPLPAARPSPAADAARDWEARPLQRTAGAGSPVPAGSPSLDYRMPVAAGAPRQGVRSPTRPAGRLSWARVTGVVLVVGAVAAGVAWWFLRAQAAATDPDPGPRSAEAGPGHGLSVDNPKANGNPGWTGPAVATKPPPASVAPAAGAVERRDRTQERAVPGARGRAKRVLTGPGPAAAGPAVAGPAAGRPDITGTAGARSGAAAAGASGAARHPTVPPLPPGVEAPEPAEVPDATYPAAALGTGLAPTVRLAVLVDEKGSVVEVRVLEGDTSHLGFNEAAVTAVRRARFIAATKDGVPVRAWGELAVDFVSPAKP